MHDAGREVLLIEAADRLGGRARSVCRPAMSLIMAVAGFIPLGAIRWRHVPLIGGSYSHAKIGYAGMRQLLVEPVDGRIFFAGEACSREDFSTAHAAYLTGVSTAYVLMQHNRHETIQKYGKARNASTNA